MFDKVKNYGQVMTPDNIVNHMIDILNLTQKEINTSLFLDNSCGDGAFITGLLNRGVPKEHIFAIDIDADIIKASIEALIVAVNKLDQINTADTVNDPRMIEIMNYIQANYIDVTLDDLAEKFYLSKPYLSKYIKEKSGVTFGELVKKVRMKKARAMLKSSSMTVENIALTVGYQNVEHFNRLFKKAYNMTPVQFRNQK